MTHPDPIQQAVDQWVDMERNAARYVKLPALLLHAEGGVYVGKTPQEMNDALDQLPDETGHDHH